ncbi:LRR receptor-like serine threonine-protein kinase [Seminavis robusta]|uniref:LRR receptor-like serine threonine-protein kinase n=1 Tax=Seminavis robusta TaxID=568900 RepID=A0A9N8H298_9STRA|nr:LRR receptor-like serine threonine-protein kinase [Seminavis robusta]|eukprot:Sro32_g020710.1 LRR receptor-like serine threonine-protein kinase (937) ;mRNA; f:38090-40900
MDGSEDGAAKPASVANEVVNINNIPSGQNDSRPGAISVRRGSDSDYYGKKGLRRQGSRQNNGDHNGDRQPWRVLWRSSSQTFMGLRRKSNSDTAIGKAPDDASYPMSAQTRNSLSDKHGLRGNRPSFINQDKRSRSEGSGAQQEISAQARIDLSSKHGLRANRPSYINQERRSRSEGSEAQQELQTQARNDLSSKHGLRGNRPSFISNSSRNQSDGSQQEQNEPPAQAGNLPKKNGLRRNSGTRQQIPKTPTPTITCNQVPCRRTSRADSSLALDQSISAVEPESGLAVNPANLSTGHLDELPIFLPNAMDNAMEDEEIVLDRLESGTSSSDQRDDVTPGEPEPELSIPADTSHLAVATLLANEEEDGDLQLARPMAARKKDKISCGWRMMLAGAGLFFAVALTAGIGAGVARKKRTEEGNDTMDSAFHVATTPPQSEHDALLALFPNSTQEAILKDPFSPQAHAFHWILGDPFLPNYTEHRILQRTALATLYYATGGRDKWLMKGVTAETNTWLRYNVSECDWPFKTSFTLDQKQYTVTRDQRCNKDGELMHLWLFNNNLQGPLVEEICLIKSLQSIALHSNEYLTGSIPSCIGSLSDLGFVFLMGNGLSNSIPSEIGLLSDSLQFLNIHSNHLSGSLPSELGQLSKLAVLWADSNPLTGPIATEIGRLSNLVSLALFDNDITGRIPSEIGGMEKLNYLQLRAKLTGTLPSEIGLLQSAVTIILYGNSLTGTLPTTLGLMSSLFLLDIRKNLLSSSLPREIGRCSSLDTLFIADNSLTSLPTELGLLPHLRRLDASFNRLSGSIATELGTATSLDGIWLDGNQLGSRLPSELGRLTKLGNFSAPGNNLSGAIPSELGLLTDLEKLHLQSNNLSGELPAQLDELVVYWNLSSLDVSDNPRLSGTVPSGLCALEMESQSLKFSCGIDLCGCGSCGCD